MQRFDGFLTHVSRGPETLLILLAAAAALAFSMWHALLNNFAVERAAFGGVEIGILQSLREVPGFLAFTTVFVLLVVREQSFALLSVALLGIGVGLTGLFATEYGLYITTVVMSVGFHYYYTLQQSLTLQWVDKARSPLAMGRQSAAASIASLAAFAAVWLGVEWLHMDYLWLYLMAGSATVIAVVLAWVWFPGFSHAVPQRRHLVVRRRYGLFYALTFMSGARRQIFVVFAGFLLVQKFGFTAAEIAALFLVNHAINAALASRIGKLIVRFGERSVLTWEYAGLVVIFVAYALVEVASIAALLYVLDHVLFAMAIGIRSYFQKIADPGDIASTAGVSFTINHVAAVIIPVVFGYVWLISPAIVFLAGAIMAGVSLLLARLVPTAPVPGNEARRLWTRSPLSFGSANKTLRG